MIWIAIAIVLYFLLVFVLLFLKFRINDLLCPKCGSSDIEKIPRDLAAKIILFFLTLSHICVANVGSRFIQVKNKI